MLKSKKGTPNYAGNKFYNLFLKLKLGFASILGYFGELPYKIFQYKNFY